MHSRPPASAYAAAVGMTVAFGLSFVATKYALRGFEPLLIAAGSLGYLTSDDCAAGDTPALDRHAA
ncbi:MAG: hypothetical protein NTW58_03175 [Actinobacteria bacterium]|nr:hypothetical protein [Actinomycetota bacterium]